MKKIALIITGIMAMATNSFAAVDLTGVTMDTTTPETLAATVIGGLAVMWGIRKLIKLTNKS